MLSEDDGFAGLEGRKEPFVFVGTVGGTGEIDGVAADEDEVGGW